MIKPILRYPDLKLLESSQPVVDFSTLSALVADMFDTMHHANGAGLAAVQIGVPLRAFIIASSLSEGGPQVFVNPEITNSTGVDMDDEGCLSFPRVSIRVQRKSWVHVRAQDLVGETFTIEAVGFHARALQHELDHLNGKVLTDYVGSFRREKIRQQLVGGTSASGKTPVVGTPVSSRRR